MGVSVRHNARLAALVALASAVMTVAWFSRALQSGSAVDWAWCVLVAAVGVLQLVVIRDSRAPLMVADEHGVRVRRGETWSGLRWQDIEHVDVQSPGSWLRDGRLVVHPRAVTEGPEPGAVDAESLSTVGIHEGGSSTPGTDAYVVPLARTTRLRYDDMTGDLVSDLDSLASGRVPVLVLTRLESSDEAPAPAAGEHSEEPGEPFEGDAAGTDAGAARIDTAVAEEATEAADADALVDEAAESVEVTEGVEVEHLGEGTPAGSGRWAAVLGRFGRRAPRPDPEQESVPGPAAEDETVLPDVVAPDVVLPGVAAPEPAAEQILQQAPGQALDPVDPVEPVPEFEPVAPGRETRPAARSEVVRESVRTLPAAPPALPAQRSLGSTLVVSRVDDFVVTEPRPAREPLIGPLIAAARNRARLSIDVLSERTRIRPHVLECIEVDDFAVCGGDFYARGHLRTLARVFGLDAQQLLDLYDDNYATAEIEARQVFEAELAAGLGGGVRATSTGPRWSLLVACVLALATVWAMARVFNDSPEELVSPAPSVVDAAGLTGSEETATKPQTTLAPLEVAAEGASPQVVVRDRGGRILWAGKLAEGQRQQVIGLAPFEVTSSNGGAVQVRFLGKPKGVVGESAEAASRQFG